MLTKKERSEIIALIQQEVIPAIGCTEPMAVALAVAKAVEILGVVPQKIDVYLSANMLKNAMGVGIPGTGMAGLPIAIAMGALVGKSEYGLEVLRDITPDTLDEGKRMIDQKRINVHLKENISEKLYIEVLVSAENKTAKAVISHAEGDSLPAVVGLKINRPARKLTHTIGSEKSGGITAHYRFQGFAKT